MVHNTTKNKQQQHAMTTSPSKAKKATPVSKKSSPGAPAPARAMKKRTPPNPAGKGSANKLIKSARTKKSPSPPAAPVRPPFSLFAPAPGGPLSSPSKNNSNLSNISHDSSSVFSGDMSQQQQYNEEASYIYHGQHPHQETGLGTTHIPHRQPVHDISNDSGCFHCPTATCICNEFEEIMQETISDCDMRRETDGKPGRKDLCAKSLNANFVSRLIRELNLEAGDTFFDFGSGNGSILFQVAVQVPGVKCVGVELNPHNALLSNKLWSMIRPKLNAKFLSSSGQQQQQHLSEDAITIITGDALELVAQPDFWKNASNTRTKKGPVILCNNVLWPRTTTHYLQERCRDAPLDTRICCFDDFFPHGRSVCQSRDPEAFQLFEMKDYVWPKGAVEWAPSLEGRFYLHRKIRNREDLSDEEDE